MISLLFLLLAGLFGGLAGALVARQLYRSPVMDRGTAMAEIARLFAEKNGTLVDTIVRRTAIERKEVEKLVDAVFERRVEGHVQAIASHMTDVAIGRLIQARAAELAPRTPNRY